MYIITCPCLHDVANCVHVPCLQMPGKGGKNAGFIRELEAQEKLVKMQRELEKAKEQLYKIRKERAKH